VTRVATDRSWPDSDQWRKSGRAFADNGRDATRSGQLGRSALGQVTGMGPVSTGARSPLTWWSFTTTGCDKGCRTVGAPWSLS